LISLCAMTFLAALETTVITTALPTILERLAINGEYAWVNCSFFLTRFVGPPIRSDLC
jgi:MFS family permease